MIWQAILWGVNFCHFMVNLALTKFPPTKSMTVATVHACTHTRTTNRGIGLGSKQVPMMAVVSGNKQNSQIALFVLLTSPLVHTSSEYSLLNSGMSGQCTSWR